MKKQSLLLDGQQSTSIALGHFNPFDNNSENFFLKTYKPSVWIDLNTANASRKSKIHFSLSNTIHPWGYQLK
jgi:hypothetical protein